MKRIVMIFALWASGWCASYDPFLLETQLSLLPKIAILEKNLLPRTNTPIKILIAYDQGDEVTAATCIRILTNRFNGRLNGHPIIVTALPIDQLDTNTGSYHLVYALKASMTQLKKIQNSVGQSGALTALYDASKLGENGFLISILMERTPVILINAKVLRENRFSFPDSLLEITRIVP